MKLKFLKGGLFIFIGSILLFSGIASGDEPSPFMNPALLQKSGVKELGEPLPSVDTLEGLVSKWVNLRKEITEEKRKWKEQKAQLKQELALLGKEKNLLEEEISHAKAERLSAETQRAELIQEKKSLGELLDNSLPALSRAEAQLRRWKELLPQILVKPLLKSFDQLEKTEGKTISQRLQSILALYTEIERLENNIHLIKESLEVKEGQIQEMDILYLGLTQAFAISRDNKIAGIGRPGKNGWHWIWHPEIAGEVRRTISFYKREKTADFVHLPLEVTEIDL